MFVNLFSSFVMFMYFIKSLLFEKKDHFLIKPYLKPQYLSLTHPQVNYDLLVKIASRRQNVTELTISRCGVQDHGVCSLAPHCAGRQSFTVNS